MYKTMLTADDLRAVADKLDALKQANVDVREFKMGPLTIRVSRRDDQREGTTYYVTRMSSGSGFNTRSVVDNDEAVQR
jgi:hypothetical protein